MDEQLCVQPEATACHKRGRMGLRDLSVGSGYGRKLRKLESRRMGGGFQEDEIGKEWNIPERRNHISSSILKNLGLAQEIE